METSSSFGIYIIPVIIAIVLFIAFSFTRSFYKVATANEAIIISGGTKKKSPDSMGFRIVTGGGAFVIPGLQTAQRLSLNLHEAALSTDCVTHQGIPVGIRGVAIYQVGNTDSDIANAARNFLGQENVMDRNIQNVFDGHLRSIIGSLSIEDLIRDREKLTGATRDAAGIDMAKLGLSIQSLQISEITDPTKYIENLAKPHIAMVNQAARIAQAAADQASVEAEQAANAFKAAAQRESSIKQAGYKAEIDKAQAESSQQGPLAAARAQQQVVIEQTRIAQLEADRAEQQLQVDVRKPADAQAYATKVTAEAQRDANISSAEAEAKRVELDATAQANAKRITGNAEADATRARGLASADASKAQLLSEAEGISARAKALSENQEAVINQIIAEKLPEIVREAAQAFASIKNLTVLEGGVGMNKMLNNIVGSGMAMMPLIKESMMAFKTATQTPQEDIKEIKTINKTNKDL